MSALIALMIAASPPIYFPEDLAKSTYRCSADGDRAVPFVDAGTLAAYATVLQIANERPIFPDQPSKHKRMAKTVRFTWLRTFHAPVVIRIEIDEKGKAQIFATRLSGQGGYSFGSIADQPLKTLSRDEAKKIIALFRAEAFPPAQARCGPPGMDGARWLLEGVDDAGYHFSERWSPRKGHMHDLGVYMLELVGWTEDIY
ncbi:hypothetical protein OSJ57_00955 [Sphingomonas sp. HH69]